VVGTHTNKRVNLSGKLCFLQDLKIINVSFGRSMEE